MPPSYGAAWVGGSPAARWPGRGGAILVFARMNRIFEWDAENQDLIVKTAAPFPQRWGLLRKRARRLQERRSSIVIQLFAGGGGIAPRLNLPIARFPGPPCV